ncbi:hypothetical protein SFR_5763 [Streptomyces sp. FR-008]|nr:hypothetical protein SFR_5763 [Streptomyces sp. FR-008]
MLSCCMVVGRARPACDRARTALRRAGPDPVTHRAVLPAVRGAVRAARPRRR